MPTGRRKTTPYVRRRIAERERAAFAKSCRNCGASVLVGLDGDVCALTVRVDPVPVSAGDELLARAVGITAYRARSRGEFVELDRRDRWQVMGEPAGTSEGVLGSLFPVVVYLEHVCPDGSRS